MGIITVEEVKELNVVNCGHCGKVFGHELGVHEYQHELYCPYCGFHADLSDFPDLYYYPDHEDSIVNIQKKRCRKKK